MTQILETLKSLERRATEGTPTQAPPAQPTPTYPPGFTPTQGPSQSFPPHETMVPLTLHVERSPQQAFNQQDVQFPPYGLPHGYTPPIAENPPNISQPPNQPIHHQPQITNPNLNGNPAISPFHSHKTLEEP
ncbi:early nodulin-75-like [Abrus precatorius]|uniref:Early nodulin-75-like n=1 Tax=Abrus precatorius TaxID=3816 RepID=A0A8B8KPN0_ABRPR|nr:early nodulin-75-like [Abrus precatorius]